MARLGTGLLLDLADHVRPGEVALLAGLGEGLLKVLFGGFGHVEDWRLASLALRQEIVDTHDMGIGV